MRRIIVVSNRLGVTAQRFDGDELRVISAQPTHPSLAAGVESTKGFETVWVGTIAGDATTEADQERVTSLLWKEARAVPVFVDPEVFHGHYDICCKSFLWPLFHYMLSQLPSDSRADVNSWSNYAQVNSLFAHAIASVWRPNDLIVIHDYHLMLAPQLTRALLPKASISFFLHVPFPSSEVFRCLPHRATILRGLLGADLLGFQTYDYARHFLSCCARQLGVESTPTGVQLDERFVFVQIFAVGVDYNRLNMERQSEAVLARVEALRQRFSGLKVIVGRDKLDYTKGITHKMLAFERFLADYPAWRGKVVLLQMTTTPREPSDEGDLRSPQSAAAGGSNTSPSNNNNSVNGQLNGTKSPPLSRSKPQPDSRQLVAQISEVVNRVNARFGSIDYTPIIHALHDIEREECLALFTVADLCLVTAVRDGMNLTCHEYVVCQQEKHSPLLLSEFAGSAGSLGTTMLVNPWDYSETARCLDEALLMSPQDLLAKYVPMISYIKQHTTQFWFQSIVSELNRLATLDLPHHTDAPPLDLTAFVKACRASNHRLFLLDYDGTLTPIRATPEAAVPSEELLRILRALAAQPNTHVFIVSGRDQAFLDEHVGSKVAGVGMSAEHGSFIRFPHADRWQTVNASVDMSWKADILPLFEFYTERTPGSFIEQKRSSLTWHYRLADPNYGSWQAKECQTHLESGVLSKYPIEVLIGKKNLEVRPVCVSKGDVVRRLLAIYTDTDFVFCAGDDRTDEDMFASLRKNAVEDMRLFTCLVGSNRSTQALWVIDSPADVLSALGRACEQGPTIDPGAFKMIKSPSSASL